MSWFKPRCDNCGKKIDGEPIYFSQYNKKVKFCTEECKSQHGSKLMRMIAGDVLRGGGTVNGRRLF